MPRLSRRSRPAKRLETVAILAGRSCVTLIVGVLFALARPDIGKKRLVPSRRTVVDRIGRPPGVSGQPIFCDVRRE